MSGSCRTPGCEPTAMHNRRTVGIEYPAAKTPGKILSAYKAVSVRQPYASMIAGLVPGRGKTIETRTWSTAYRGPLVIVASKRPAAPPVGLYGSKPPWPKGEYPTGKAICLCRLVACRIMTWRDCEKARCDLYRGAYAWVLDDIRRIDPPQPVKGQLGIYTIELATEDTEN